MSIGCWTWKSWDVNLPETTWLVSTRISNNHACPTEKKPLHAVRGATVPVVHAGNWMGKRVWVAPALGKGKPTRGIVFAQGLWYTWWDMPTKGISSVCLKEIQP